jgi:hypothetical protein
VIKHVAGTGPRHERCLGRIIGVDLMYYEIVGVARPIVKSTPS